MNAIVSFVLTHRRSVLALWAICLLAALPLALRLPSVLQGSSEAIRGSESEYVMKSVQREFGTGSAYPAVVVVRGKHASFLPKETPAAIEALEAALRARIDVQSVTHAWNSGRADLIGRDGKSALLLVQSRSDSMSEAESFTAVLRKHLEDALQGNGLTAKVTGPSAMFHDVNQNSSADLLRAEMVGIPLTLFILLIVFGSPAAAGLALALAFAAVILSAAALYVLSNWMPVTLFAQNTITIIGLGAGVDYCLFVLYRYRSALRQGMPAPEALLSAWSGVGSAVMVAGLTVGVGFLALFLVDARVLHSLAIGGLLVTFGAVAAAITLLPVLLHYLTGRISWFGDAATESTLNRALQEAGSRLARRVMARPWLYLASSLLLVAVTAAPALRMNSWSVGVSDLPAGFEARDGYEDLEQQFEKGWMGPVVILVESRRKKDASQEQTRRAVLEIVSAFERDERVAQVYPFPGPVEPTAAMLALPNANDAEPGTIPGEIADPPRIVTALHVITRYPPESEEMMEFVREMRARKWDDAVQLKLRVGGTSALILDFDTEMFDSLRRVVPAVLAVSFLTLMFFFRSILIPLKAVTVNLLSVLAAYGFLVFVFQDGFGLGTTGTAPTGGLNSFVVLMLFTILFGLSMDYEVVLLRQIQEHYRRSGNNTVAVAHGLRASAGVITSAAAIMVCLFASLSFAQLAATRQFGLGMAFAVALDASVIRMLLIPAMMALLGRANWWFPTRARPRAVLISPAESTGVRNACARDKHMYVESE